MEKEDKISKDTENLKNETVETAKKLKESIKETDIKQETLATKGVIVEMVKNPLEKIKEIANNTSTKYLKTALLLIILWTLIVFIDSSHTTIHFYGFSRVFTNLLNVLKEILAPACGIIVYSLIVLCMNHKNKKPLSAIISTITITQLPLMIASLVSLFTIISSRISLITTPFAQLCSVVSIVLGYFGFKNLLSEEKSKDFIKKYVLIQTIYFVVAILFSLLEIYI